MPKEMSFFVNVAIEGSTKIPTGKIALMRDGALVWFGDLTAPWEDAVFDRVIVSDLDFDKIAARCKDLLGPKLRRIDDDADPF